MNIVEQTSVDLHQSLVYTWWLHFEMFNALYRDGGLGLSTDLHGTFYESWNGYITRWSRNRSRSKEHYYFAEKWTRITKPSLLATTKWILAWWFQSLEFCMPLRRKGKEFTFTPKFCRLSPPIVTSLYVTRTKSKIPQAIIEVRLSVLWLSMVWYRVWEVFVQF